ncbi:MAG: S49 family peptidase [Opitutaceae bacterium]|jgi:protease-4
MRYAHIISALRSTKWAAKESVIVSIRDLLQSRLTQSHALAPAIQAPRLQGLLGGSATRSTVGVVEISGIIGKRLDSMETECGGCDLDSVEADIRNAVADPLVKSIVLYFDSPGGSVTGVPELADKIRSWTKEKPIYAYTTTMMCSAAYWLASACSGVFAAGSSDVGSIGVYMAWLDCSEMYAKEGLKLELIKAGARKGEGIEGSSLSDETRTAWQAEVDSLWQQFKSAVLIDRPGVPEPAMQGQSLMGTDAKAAGLVDEVIPDLATLISELGG